MDKFYFILWAILAIYLFATAKKTGKLCYALSAFFVFMSVWYGIDSFSGIDMFADTLGIIFKCIVGIFLVFLIVIYIISKRKK